MMGTSAVRRRWEREYEEHGVGVVASPNNAMSVAVYVMQGVLGLGHAVGVTTPKAFPEVFTPTLLVPWVLLYVVGGFLGAFTVLVLRGVSGTRMQWAVPETAAAVCLVVANGMYLASLILGFVGDNFPTITVLAFGALFAGAAARVGQLTYERMKSAFMAKRAGG